MGKGTIKNNLGEGQYQVQINLAQSAKTRLLEALESKIEIANQVVEDLKREIEELTTETPEPDPEPDPEVEEPDPEPDPPEDPEYDEESPPETGTATITGITQDEEMANLAGITVTAYAYIQTSSTSSTFSNRGSAVTLEDGTFTIPGLAAGDYTLKFEDPNGIYKTEYYSNKTNLTESTRFTVADEGTVTGKNAVLSSASSISGTVTSL